MLLMQFMSFHYIFQAVDRTNWNLERIMQQLTHAHPGDDQLHLQRQPRGHLRRAGGVRIALPFITWCLAHYAIAMIFYGEGALKDIAVSPGSPSRRSSCSPGQRR